MPHIMDLNAETAKLTMLHGRTPQTRFTDRPGSAARLAPFRNGALQLGKTAGKNYWETHPGDELGYVLDRAVTLEIIAAGERQSVAVGAGTLTIVPPDA